MHLHPLSKHIQQIESQPNIFSISVEIKDDLVASVIIRQKEAGNMLDQLLLVLCLNPICFARGRRRWRLCLCIRGFFRLALGAVLDIRLVWWGLTLGPYFFGYLVCTSSALFGFFGTSEFLAQPRLEVLVVVLSRLVFGAFFKLLWMRSIKDIVWLRSQRRCILRQSWIALACRSRIIDGNVFFIFWRRLIVVEIPLYFMFFWLCGFSIFFNFRTVDSCI